MAITLIGKGLASEGREFYYLGRPEECDGCKLSTVCHNLETGARYRVTSVRGQEHDCAVLEDEPMVAVEVEKVPTPAILPKKGLLEGITVTFSESKCDEIGCINYTLCHPIGKVEGTKYTVKEMGKDAECPRGDRLVNVKLLRRGRSER